MSNVGRLTAKLFSPEPAVPDEHFVPIFHKWIRKRALGGVLFDVADYTHVPEGPGVVLVGHDTTFSLDRSSGQFGLLAQARRPFLGDAVEGVVATLEALFAAADAIERDVTEAGLRLDRTRIRIEANDRLRAPNTDGGFVALRLVVAAAAQRLFVDREIIVERVENDRRERLAIDVILRVDNQSLSAAYAALME
jgi:hypothetical protein